MANGNALAFSGIRAKNKKWLIYRMVNTEPAGYRRLVRGPTHERVWSATHSKTFLTASKLNGMIEDCINWNVIVFTALSTSWRNIKVSIPILTVWYICWCWNPIRIGKYVPWLWLVIFSILSRSFCLYIYICISNYITFYPLKSPIFCWFYPSMSGVRNTSKPSVIEPNNNAYNKLATAHGVCLKIGISPQKWLVDLDNDYIPVDENPFDISRHLSHFK